MRQLLLTLFILLAVGVVAIAEGPYPNAQTPTAPQVTNVSGTDGAGTEGTLEVSTVEVAAGTVATRESHLGVQVVYVLEGAGSLAVDGQPPVALKAGAVVQFAPKQNYMFTNISKAQTLKVLVIDPVETGQPHLVLTKSGTHQQKEARQQNEGCQLIPNEDLSQQKNNEQVSSTMKGLVF